MADDESAPEEPYYTVDTCTKCGADVDGLHHRWTCRVCGQCSPYTPPPEGWQADPGYRQPPDRILPLPPRRRTA